GISFYTFQTLSYTLDVYRGKIEPEQHFGLFAVYVSFFPQLVAGPIERAGRLLPQFRSPQKLNYVRIVHGMRRILIGLFKKVVVADFLAHYVDLIYCRPEDFAGSAVILASIFFAFQIYCDFAGYTDIAIGSAQVLGIRLGENFRGPYLARSLGEFWRRWHISLSTWFRDYVYLPLGGNRGFWAILVVFLLSGLWHGANWTYVLWGLLHGMLLLLETKLKPWSKKLGRIFGSGMQRLLTFSAVTALWVIFRAENLAQARLLFSKMLHPGSWSLSTLDIMGNRFDFFLSLILIGGLLGADFAAEKMPFADRLAQWPRTIRWAVYYAMIFILLIVGINSQRPFMYFQF
ncbi:MAG TPA: MBOAT family protein, partial [Bacteroidetes bacterium]|nr:MBOAT family protein [Bacteroidota bacterium]